MADNTSETYRVELALRPCCGGVQKEWCGPESFLSPLSLPPLLLPQVLILPLFLPPHIHSLLILAWIYFQAVFPPHENQSPRPSHCRDFMLPNKDFFLYCSGKISESLPVGWASFKGLSSNKSLWIKKGTNPLGSPRGQGSRVRFVSRAP